MAKRTYTHEEIVSGLHEARRALGRVPTMSDLDEGVEGLDLPVASTVKVRFGSWSKALKSIFGVDVRRGNQGTPEDRLVRDMKRLYRQLGRAPSSTEMSSDPDTVHANSFIRRYGSWAKAVKAILGDDALR